MRVIRSADRGRSETLTVESRGTAGPARLVRVQINDPIIGAVGINVEFADLLPALARLGPDDVTIEPQPQPQPQPPPWYGTGIEECCASGRCEICSP